MKFNPLQLTRAKLALNLNLLSKVQMANHQYNSSRLVTGVKAENELKAQLISYVQNQPTPELGKLVGLAKQVLK